MAEPVNTAVPAITGTVDVGETLTASTGTWTGGVDSYAFQWYRVNDNSAVIPGATSSTYVITTDDGSHTLKVGVIATNNTGPSIEAFSLATIAVPQEWFVVETGAGLATAVSLCSNEEADQYHARRGNTTWTALSHTAKHGHLIRATDYMTETYRMRWAGERMTETQALDWPRQMVPRKDSALSNYYANNVVPQEVKNACAELALRAAAGNLLADQTQRKASVSVGPISTTYEAGSTATVQYKAIDALLRPLLKLGSSQIQLVRT